VTQTLFAALSRNRISLTGVILAAFSAVLIVVLFALVAAGLKDGLFLDIVSYLILPAIFVLGLLLVFLGIWLQRRRERTAAAQLEASPPPLPVIDFNNAATRASAVMVLLLAAGAVVILAGAGYKGVELLESTQFCGQACHFVMQPEAVAHQRSPHADVSCVQCHIGPGASWFVKSKINGTMELVDMITNDYPRPIPTPIDNPGWLRSGGNLRPARVVCEQCHWPAEFIGDKLVVNTHYGEDEKNSPTKTVLMLHVGGQAGKSSTGIHWHVGSGIAIRYLSDPSRENIYSIEVKTADGAQKTFKNSAVPPVDAQWRTMDCVDCHNRPAHTFHEPAEEIDAALGDGRIDTSLPFIKREGLRVLKSAYPSQAQARTGILREIDQFYRTQYPAVASERASAVSQAGRALTDIWAWNVFPQMKVTWNTYPVHLGHQQSPGCWRCHDDEHVTEKGEKIGQQCGLCHNIVAQDEAAPAVLKDLE